jgi:hypothetical protein
MQKVRDPPSGHMKSKINAVWGAMFAMAFTVWRNKINTTIIQQAIGESNVPKALLPKRTFLILIYCLI